MSLSHFFDLTFLLLSREGESKCVALPLANTSFNYKRFSVFPPETESTLNFVYFVLPFSVIHHLSQLSQSLFLLS